LPNPRAKLGMFLDPKKSKITNKMSITSDPPRFKNNKVSKIMTTYYDRKGKYLHTLMCKNQESFQKL